MEHDPRSGPLIDERRWRGANLTAILGTSAVVAGALLLVGGWYGVSGESDVAYQLPYIASATVPGAVLVIVGVVLLAPVLRGDSARAEELGRLVELLTEPVADDTTEPARPVAAATATTGPGTGDATAAAHVLALPDGTRYHRPGCALVVGKPGAGVVTASVIAERGLEPCPACQPDAPTASDPAG